MIKWRELHVDITTDICHSLREQLAAHVEPFGKRIADIKQMHVSLDLPSGAMSFRAYRRPAAEII